jgi:hypothetical protein
MTGVVPRLDGRLRGGAAALSQAFHRGKRSRGLSVVILQPPSKHPDPIGWTDAMRAEILNAFYAILIGNPTLKLARDAPMKTRFKMWWPDRLGVEHAALLVDPDHAVDFEQLFLARDDDDDDTTSVVEALNVMLRVWMGQSFGATADRPSASSASYTKSGGLGSLLRWLTGRVTGEHYHGDFPVGTFLINV